jgi:hypothetical protein
MILTNCENCTQTRNKFTLIPSIGSLFCSSPCQKKVTQKRESRVIREALCPLTQGVPFRPLHMPLFLCSPTNTVK